MNKIRVIDLLNMVANKEYDKLPKKVKHSSSCFIYKYDERLKDYDNENNHYLFEHAVKFGAYSDEVEIIEDTEENTLTKIEKIEIDNCCRIKAPSTGNFAYNISAPQKIIITKLNEIIERLNEVND